ncbi:MAG: glycosyl transferase family protein [Halioglobus sp.]|nr:glycosyl transferase family protein [Halioglobus sp.]
MAGADQEHPFARFVRILGKGRTGTRDLTRAEAREAFGMILRGEAQDVQLGAFLMLLRVKEESAEEIAGFVEACRDSMLQPPPDLAADLDWSSYAGKKHQHPWYILSMLLLADAGYRVFVHGASGHTPGRLYTQESFAQLDLPVVRDWDEAAQALDATRLCYMPLQRFCPALDDIINLRPLFGLRSPVNTLTRLLNPLAAPASIQSIFHPAYAAIHQQADQLLEQPAALVFKGESGEIEVKPHADTRMFTLRSGQFEDAELPRSIDQRATPVAAPSVDPLRNLWRAERDDRYGRDATLATLGAALALLEPHLTHEQAAGRAQQLWRERDRSRLG